MLAFLIYCAVLALLAGLLLLMPIRIDIHIVLIVDQEQRILDLEILPLGREKWKQRHHLQVPPGQLITLVLEKLSQKQRQYKPPRWFNSLSTAQKIMVMQRIMIILKQLLSATHIKELDWRSIYGGEDAMLTGVITGTLWAAKGMFISMVSSWCHLENMYIGVDPDFNQERLRSRFSGIFSVRLAHIILVGAHIIVWMVRGYFYGRTAARKAAQPPHRGVNENCYAEY